MIPLLKLKLLTLVHAIGGYCCVTAGFTGIAALILHTHGPGTLTELFWFKLLTSGIFAFLLYRGGERYRAFHMNIGLPKYRLLVTALVLDLLLVVGVALTFG